MINQRVDLAHKYKAMLRIKIRQAEKKLLKIFMIILLMMAIVN